MDLTSLVGPVFALAMILIGLILEGGHVSSIIQITAFIIVIGGMVGSLMVAYTLPDLIGAMKSIGTWLKNPSADPDD